MTERCKPESVCSDNLLVLTDFKLDNNTYYLLRASCDVKNNYVIRYIVRDTLSAKT